jgi:Zn-dependent protease with chaperone function
MRSLRVADGGGASVRATLLASAAATQACPNCGASIPLHPQYVAWCERCDWNVTAPAVADVAEGPLGRVYSSAGRRLGDRLALRLLEAESLEPRLTFGRVASYVIAALVFVAALAMLVGGVLLAVLAFPNPFAVFFGVVLVGAGFLMRPRFGKIPDENVLTREEAPRLHARVEQVAELVATRPADVLEISEQFNASWAVLGLRRRRVLTLGLPLLVALSPQEQVALIAHELAHARNGDASRGLLVGSAVRSLGELYYLVAPGGGVVFAELTFLARAMNILYWLVSRPILGLLHLELHLLLRDTQRAEYYADALAARVAGTDATVGLLEKLLLEPTVRSVAQRLVHDRDSDADVFDEITRAVAIVPERERERRRRVARLESARLDATHPPTGLRIRLLEDRPNQTAQLTLSPIEAAAIDQELRRFRGAFHDNLLDAYRDKLYTRHG